MASDDLRNHYNNKYAGEIDRSSTDTVTGWTTPTDRFKATVCAAHRHFAGGTILELGAGDGRIARTLLSELAGIESYVLSDWSESRVSGLRSSFDDRRVEVMQIDAQDVPSSLEGRFDAILMVALIEHLIDPMSAMTQIRCLLKPGGWVYIDTPNIAKWTRRLKLLAGQFPSTASREEGLQTYDRGRVTLHDEGHLHYFTFRSLDRMLVDYCGFARTEKFGYVPGKFPIGDGIGFALAQRLPTVLSEAAVFAYR